MKRVSLVLGTHNSLPPGANDTEKEEVYLKSYKPFLMDLYNHPRVKVSLHYSGHLLEWMETEHPEFITVLNEMIDRRQVEILGGAFYDPFLPLIPDSDRVGQIEMLTTYIRKLFGRRPRGCWLPQRVWDPSLATVLKRCGMEYVFLAEDDFTASGFTARDLAAPCVVEDQGKPVTVLPTNREVGYLVPFGEPQEILEGIFRYALEEGESLLSLMIPGEKLGFRNETNKRCYSQNWVKRFLGALEKEQAFTRSELNFSSAPETSPDFDSKKQEFLELIHGMGYLRQKKVSRPRAYFPPSSYDELMSWCRPKEQKNEYITEREQMIPRSSRGTSRRNYFRQVLSVYPESRRLYDRMLYSSLLVSQVRGDQYRKKAAREELWRGQSHYPFWFNRYGGIYRNRYRKEAYKALIEADRLTRVEGIFVPSVGAVDFDMDGIKEYLYRGHKLNGFVHRRGGVLFELDHLKTGWNYLDTLARRREPYPEISGEETPVDSYSRSAFVDHFFQAEDDVHAFEQLNHREGGVFHDLLYEERHFNRDNPQVHLEAEGPVTLSRRTTQIHISKSFRFKKDGVEVSYAISNAGPREIQGYFASEVNLSLAGLSREDQTLYSAHTAASSGELKLTELKLKTSCIKAKEEYQVYDWENRMLLTLRAVGASELWLLPVMVTFPQGGVSYSEYQSTCFVPRWELSLMPGETQRINLSLFMKRS